jgi:hypothetical protein
MSLTSMEEAFKKSGLVSEKEIEKRETIHKEKEQRVKEVEIKRGQFQEELNRHQQQKIQEKFKPFDERWKDPKKQKFLVHLLFAYIPSDVAHHPWTNKELREKKCCVCGQSLISMQFVIDNKEKFFLTSIDQLRRMAIGEAVQVRKEFEKEFGDVVMAVVSPKSSAAFCTPCYKNFYEWIQNMLLRGNQQIHRIVRRRQLESTFTPVQLKEYDSINQIKNVEERRKKTEEFLEKVIKKLDEEHKCVI